MTTTQHPTQHPGAERAWAAMREILAHPEAHDQAIWLRRTDCGTTACLAGRVALQAGATPIWENPLDRYMRVDGQKVRVDKYAQELLHITYETAYGLFMDTAHMSAPELAEVVTDIFGPDPLAGQEKQA